MNTEDDNQFDIAIIGMAGRFPGAANVSEFWNNLLEGKVSHTRFTKEELIEAGVPASQVEDPDYVCLAPVLEGAEEFDAEFFGYSPHEAKLIDPQQRQLLETAWQALENAGYDPSRTDSRIATFAGTAMNTYMLHTGLADHFFEEYLPTLLGADKDFLATRIAYKLGITGPAVTVQTACSTSLVATHLACQSILNQESDMALVGAAAVRAPLKVGHMYEQGSVFSSDGFCKPFDDAADGTIFGSGVGVLVLKRMADAINDEDNICAVIKGSAINNDGATKSDFTAPSINKQAEAIVDAYASAGVTADTISYIEAHGTGTYLGDPIEIEALSRAFRVDTSDVGFCGVGSVKSNIGHLDAAAGVASMIKVVKSLQSEKLPATANFKKSNSQIDFQNSPFFVVDKTQDWKSSSSETPLRAGITSLGMGGTNGHVVIEQAPASVARSASASNRPYLFPVSAKSDYSLKKNVENLTQYLDNNPDVQFNDVAFTLRNGRQVFNKRKVIVTRANSAEDGFDLDNVVAMSVGSSTADIERSVVFMFPGQGSQFLGMGRDLYEKEAVFKQAIDTAGDEIKKIHGIDLVDAIYGDATDPSRASNLKQTSITQPALYAVEYAYAKLFQSWGVEPAALIGHSIGEYVAAALAGVFSYVDGLKIVAERGRIMQAAETGSMLSVPLPADRVKSLIGDSLDIGVINSQEACVVSGTHELIDELAVELQKQEIESQRLRTSHAFHSRLMDAAALEFEQSISEFDLRAAKTPFISNVTGDWISDDQAQSPAYWASQIRNTVLFSQGLQTLFNSKAAVFLECGPSTTLSQLVNGDQHVGVSSSRHPKVEQCDQMVAYGALAKLWTAGVEIDWAKVSDTDGRRIPLPSYHFNGKPFWFERPKISNADGAANALVRENSLENWFWRESWEYSPNENSAIKNIDLTLLIDTGEALQPAQIESLAGELDGSLIRVGKEDQNQILARHANVSSLRIVVIPDVNQSSAAINVPLDVMDAVKAIDENVNGELELVLLTKESTAVLDRAIQDSGALGLAGLARVIDNEYQQISVRQIDLPDFDQATLMPLVARLNRHSQSLVESYAEGRWWSRSFTRVRLPDTAIPSPLTAQCHVVIGAFGGVGQILASHLSKQVDTLVLTGTYCAPEEDWAQIETTGSDQKTLDQIKLIRQLRDSGTNVITHSMDVTDKNAVDSLFVKLEQNKLQAKFVFNLAGANNDSLLSLKSREEAQKVIEPKVLGTKHLLDNIVDLTDTRLVLFSSTAAWLGIVGQADYAVANAFQISVSHLARYKNKAISIGWSGWADVGMFGRMADSTGKSSAAINAIEQTEALAILERILSDENQSSVVVSPVSINTLLDQNTSTNSLVDDVQVTSNDSEESSYSAEKIVSSMWQESLGVDSLGKSDNFFALGGNSLMITQLVSKLRKTYSLKISLKEATAKPVVSNWISLCETAMEQGEDATPAQISPESILASEFSLSPGVFRFLDRRKGAAFSHWNLCHMLECKSELDDDALQQAIRTVTSHHRMIRGNVVVNETTSLMRVKEPDSAIPLSVFDLTQVSKDKLESELEKLANHEQSNFDIASGHLFKAIHFKCGSGVSDRLFLVTHHFISDGLSWTITLEDIQQAYKSAIKGAKPELPVKTMEYSDWVSALEKQANSENAEKLAKQWLEFPWDDVRPLEHTVSSASGNINSSAQHVSVRLANETSAALLGSRSISYTPPELTMVALIRALARWSTNDVVLLDVLGSGRDLDDRHDVSRTVGFFNSYSPVLVQSQYQHELVSVLPELVDQIRQLMEKGIEHDILRYMCANPAASTIMAGLPRAEVLFNYIGHLKSSNDSLLDPKLFAVAPESVGNTHHPEGMRDHKLATRVEVIDDCIDLTIVFSRNLHSEIDIRQLLNLYVDELDMLSSIYSEHSQIEVVNQT